MLEPARRRLRVATLLAPGLSGELFGPTGRAELRNLVDLVAECSDRTELAGHALGSEVEVLITSWASPRLDEELLAHMPALHTVVQAAGSVRKVVGEAVWRRGLTVVSAAEANNAPVAEYVYAQTVLALKHAHRRARHLATEHTLPSMAGIPGIYRQTIGLVSFGSIAQMLAGHLRRLDADVLAWDPFQEPEVFRRTRVTRVADLAEVVARSIVLSIHTPLIPGETEGQISGPLLRTLPPGATLINTARGAVIDEKALIEVLTDRPDLYAVLDVTTEEPPGARSALYRLPNVMLTGHVAGTVNGERRAIGRLVLDELGRIADGRSPLHAISPAAARLRA